MPDRLPDMSLITQSVRLFLNHLLDQAEWARDRLAGFSGSSLRLCAEPVEMYFTLDTTGRLSDADAPAARADVSVIIPLAKLPLLLTGGADRLMNSARIEGNADLAETLGFVFRNLEWDAEEDLSRLVGDIPAHRLAQGARSLREAHGRALQSVAGNLTEYLVEEERLLVTRPALSELAAEAVDLRDRIARLGKRIDRLYGGVGDRRAE